MEVVSTAATETGNGKFRCDDNWGSWSSETSTEASIKDKGTTVGSSERSDNWSAKNSIWGKDNSAMSVVNSKNVVECWSIEVPYVDSVPVSEIDLKAINLAVCIKTMCINQSVLFLGDAVTVSEWALHFSFSALSTAGGFCLACACLLIKPVVFGFSAV